MSNLTPLRQVREDLGFTQTEFAKRLGIWVSQYNMIERAKRKAPLSVALQISQIAGKPVNEIFLPSGFTVGETASGAGRPGKIQ